MFGGLYFGQAALGGAPGGGSGGRRQRLAAALGGAATVQALTYYRPACGETVALRPGGAVEGGRQWLRPRRAEGEAQPCGRVASQHARPGERRVRVWENVTTVTVGEETRRPTGGERMEVGPDPCGPGEARQPSPASDRLWNCYRETERTEDRARCVKVGEKAVMAEKQWHGAPHFALSQEPATVCEKLMRYRTVRVTGLFRQGTLVMTPGEFDQICTTDWQGWHGFELSVTVDRYSGVTRLHGCSLPGDEVVRGHVVEVIQNHLSVWDVYQPDGGGQPYWEAWREESHPANGCGELWQSFEWREGVAPYTSYTHWRKRQGEREYTITVTLDDPYAYEECVEDAYALLDSWDLADDAQYPWTEDLTAQVPLVMHNERLATSPLAAWGIGLPDALELSANGCAWVETNGTDGQGRPLPLPDGAVIGGPLGLTGAEPFYSFLLGEWKPEGIGLPDAATHWVRAVDAAAFPAGAWVYYDGQRVRVKKWAKARERAPGYNWFRPCGADRDWVDESTGQRRFPNAWPLCGEVAIARAEQQGAEVVLTLAAAATYLRTGDRVDFTRQGDWSGSAGTIGLANNAVVTVDSPTQVRVTGRLNPAYGGGAALKSHGAPSHWWNDARSKGDFRLKVWGANVCSGEGTFRCEDRCTPLGRCAPSVVCLSPNAEAFANGHTEWPFPPARELSHYECWQAHADTEMPDPLGTQDAEGKVLLVEARCLPPVGAPPLPPGVTLGCESEETCGRPLKGDGMPICG